MTAPVTDQPNDATRSPEECRSLVARVRLQADSFPSRPPLLRNVVVPRMDLAPSLQGKTVVIRVLVDANGLPVMDSVAFTPEVRDQRYRREFLESVARYRYRPALLEGCAVPGIVQTTITFDHRH